MSDEKITEAIRGEAEWLAARVAQAQRRAVNRALHALQHPERLAAMQRAKAAARAESEARRGARATDLKSTSIDPSSGSCTELKGETDSRSTSSPSTERDDL